MKRRKFILGAAAATVVCATPARSQGGLVRLVIPYSPGTTPDTLARIIGPGLQERLASTVIVENKPGASGMIGMKTVALSTDPGTLMIVPATTTTLPYFYKNVDFDVLRSFTPVSHIASSSFVLVVSNNVPANNLAEFIKWAKANRGAFYASPDIGTHHHLFMEMLLQSLALKLEHAPYKRTAPAINDLVAGQIPTMFLPIQVAVPMRDSGRLKIIGGSLRERHPGFPDIPSLHEQGAKNYHADPWYAVWGTSKITSELAEKYRDALSFALDDPRVKSTLTKQGIILRTSTSGELLKMSIDEKEKWERVIREAKIKPE